MKTTLIFLIILLYISCILENKQSNVAIHNNQFKLDKVKIKDRLAEINWAEINPFLKETDLKRLDLFGNVKTLREIPYLVKIKNNRIIKTDTSYYNNRNEFSLFNDVGNLIQKRTFFKNQKYNHTEYKYEKNVKKSIVNVQGQSYLANTSTFDQHGNRVTQILFNPDSTISTSYINEFDKKGNQISNTIYEENGKITLKGNSIYDSKGNLIKYSSGNRHGQFKYEHDINGNLIEVKTFERRDKQYPNYMDLKKTFKYNEKNHIVEENHFLYDRKGQLYKKRTYDINNNLIEFYEVKTKNGKKKIISKSYKYSLDEKNNWNKVVISELQSNQIEDSLFIPKYIIERQITYFE